MSKLVYQIDSTSDREGNKKDIPSEWKLQQYFIHFAMVGRGARLLYTDGSDKFLHTSTVESISMWENGIKLKTRNTVYYLKPVIKE